MGRTPAWESAYREYFVARQRSLMRTAYAILGSWPAAEDAVQTAFTQLYVHWPRIQPGAVDTYARRTVVHTCFRMAKVSAAGRRSTDRLPERPVAGPEGGLDAARPDARPWPGSRRRARAVIALRYLDDLSGRRGGARPRPAGGHGQEPDRPGPRPPPGGPRPTRVSHRTEGAHHDR